VRPRIGITPDIYDRDGVETARCAMRYADAVVRAGGEPVFLCPAAAPDLSFVRGVVLTGGDDPVTEPFGAATSGHAVRVMERRQSYETALLRALDNHPEVPVLGVCLGMQMMALVAGGTLNQHLPDTHATHADHWESDHAIESTRPEIVPGGTVHSKHRQAVDDAGGYEVIARAHDGVVEAIVDPGARWRVGVQWHPERTGGDALGLGLFRALVDAARSD